MARRTPPPRHRGPHGPPAIGPASPRRRAPAVTSGAARARPLHAAATSARRRPRCAPRSRRGPPARRSCRTRRDPPPSERPTATPPRPGRRSRCRGSTASWAPARGRRRDTTARRRRPGPTGCAAAGRMASALRPPSGRRRPGLRPRPATRGRGRAAARRRQWSDHAGCRRPRSDQGAHGPPQGSWKGRCSTRPRRRSPCLQPCHRPGAPRGSKVTVAAAVAATLRAW